MAYLVNKNLNTFEYFLNNYSTNNLSISSSKLRSNNSNVGNPFFFSLANSVYLLPSGKINLTITSF